MPEVRRDALDLQDTIFALATGSLPSAVAIVRLSGPAACDVAQQCFRPNRGQFVRRRGMWVGDWLSAQGGKLDSVLLLSFISPQSFTGQDVIEIHCHGSQAVVGRLQQELTALGLRPAGAGEFSLRAYHMGKLGTEDLETLGDVFAASQGGDLDRIYQRKDKSISDEVALARESLLKAQAILDTAVDFVEEVDSVLKAAEGPLVEARAICTRVAARYRALTGAARAPRLVLAGRPNAGKSSLFNALLCRYRAIVQEAAGTTRDAIEEDVELGGRRWKLVDTAGVRSAHSDAEREGIELGEQFLAGAQFWVLVVDGSRGLGAEEALLLERYAHIPHLVAWNKQDLPSFKDPEAGLADNVVKVSATTGSGLPALVQRLNAELSGRDTTAGPLPYAGQAVRLEKAAVEIGNLLSGLDGSLPPEILGEQNRGVLRGLEEVVGSVDVEDVLDRVFSEFCIGK